MAAPNIAGWTGAMTVDVEEAFHASALASVAPRDQWHQMESRVFDRTCRILEIFAERQVLATFFILGIVAKDSPALVRRIAEAGHEIASHGWAHHRVTELSPDAMRSDLLRTRLLLEDQAGAAVRGYRAPSFSLDHTTWWAYDILAETGHRYSSSINPVRHDHYGQPDAPRTPFSTHSGVVELPMTTLIARGRRIPVSGGGWFRLLPYAVSRHALGRAAQSGQRPIFFFHPWEIDPGQPRLAAPPKSRFRHYVNLSRMEGKVARMCADARWARLDVVYADAFDKPPLPWRPGSVAEPHSDGVAENHAPMPVETV